MSGLFLPLELPIQFHYSLLDNPEQGHIDNLVITKESFLESPYSTGVTFGLFREFLKKVAPRRLHVKSSTFNSLTYKKISFIPDSVIILQVDNELKVPSNNNLISLTIKSLKSFPSSCSSLKELKVQFWNNIPGLKFPELLERVDVSFSQSNRFKDIVNYLPAGLKFLGVYTLGSNFIKNGKNLIPESVEELFIRKMYGVDDLDYIPKTIKTLTVKKWKYRFPNEECSQFFYPAVEELYILTYGYILNIPKEVKVIGNNYDKPTMIMKKEYTSKWISWRY